MRGRRGTVLPTKTHVSYLLRTYSVLLLDAYGVLLDDYGTLPGAQELIRALNDRRKNYFVLTNSASRLPGAMARDFQRLGLNIPARRIISSGQLLGNYFRENALVGRRCYVLGTKDSETYVSLAGGEVAGLDAGGDGEIVVIADQAGRPLLEALDQTLSFILRKLDAGHELHLLLCNPDLIYPRGPGRFGFTAGALAVMFEAVFRERYPGRPVKFAQLGKPHLPIFEEAARRSGTRDMVMIGDQPATDILGARKAGLDSALLATDRIGFDADAWSGDITPTYILPSLALR